MKLILIIALFLLFSSSTCRKECQMHLTIKNNSDKNIVFALEHFLQDSHCQLYGRIIKPGEHYDWYIYPGLCLEGQIGPEGVDMYIVDPENFNEANSKPYSCDSLEIRNVILKHIILSPETSSEFKEMNWKVVYP